MPIYIHCDVCKRVMGETTIDKFKRFRKIHGERCSQCQQILDGVDEYTTKLKKMQIKKMDDYFTETKKSVVHEIQKIAQMPPPKQTLWSRLKYLISGGQKIAVQEPLPKEEEPEERMKNIEQKLVNRGG